MALTKFIVPIIIIFIIIKVVFKIIGKASTQAGNLQSSVGDLLQSQHLIPVQQGKFGATMKIEITNDGPVTVVVQQK